MSLIRSKQRITLIPLRRGAEMLCLDESTIRKGQAGTAHLTKVRQGEGKRQKVCLVLEEVEAHIASMVEFARERNSVPEQIASGK
jgi:hypothetical protein